MDELFRSSIDEQPKRAIVCHPINMEQLKHLMYPDDIALISSKRSHMQSNINSLWTNAEKYQSRINLGKIKSIKVIAPYSGEMFLDGNVIEVVEHCTYLGRRIAPDGGTNNYIDARPSKGKGAITKLRKIWRCRQLSNATEKEAKHGLYPSLYKPRFK